jgi:hypothetical protein
MSSSYAPLPTFQTTLRTFAQDPDFPFADLITEDHIRTACDERDIDLATEPHHIWTPALTLWTFLTQATSGSKSCVAAVARALVLRVGRTVPANHVASRMSVQRGAARRCRMCGFEAR